MSVLTCTGGGSKDPPPKRGSQQRSSEQDKDPLSVFMNLDPKKWSMWAPLAVAMLAGYFLTRSSGQSRQISWQEFRVNYLERGEVSPRS